MNEEVNVLEPVDEATDVLVEVTEEDGGLSAAETVAGITILAAAGYGVYQFGKRVVVPAGKKAVTFVQGLFAKKDKDGKVVEDAEFEDVDASEDEE
jgi:hypothetical protein